MLAKVIRRTTGIRGADPFAGRIAYVCAKASRIATANLAGGWQQAAWQMGVAAGLTPACRQPAYHLVLSWSPLEQPTEEAMLAAARAILQDFGAGGHQHVIALHHDRPHRHVHVILNRIHPISGRVLSTGHDFARLERACRRIEARQGWPQDRGRFDVAIDAGEITLVPKPAQHWAERKQDRARGLRPDSQALRPGEHRTGLPALRDMFGAETLAGLRRALAMARDWAGVHRILKALGLGYVRHRSGARIAADTRPWTMAASQIGSSFGLRRMERRLGPYRAADAEKTSPAPAATSVATPPDMTPDMPEATPVPDRPRWRSALAGAAAVAAARAARRQKDKEDRRARTKRAAELAAAQARERAGVRRHLGGCRAASAQALRRVMRESHREAWRYLRASQGPRPAPVDAWAEIERCAPGAAFRRRYRQSLRARELAAAVAARPGPHPDHTACRQAWVRAGAWATGLGAEEDACGGIPGLGDQLRDDDGPLLLARRDAGRGIVAFDVIDRRASPPRVIRAPGGGDGLASLGPQDATRCVCAPDAVTALMWHYLKGRDMLILIVDPEPSRAVREQLQALIAARPVTVLTTREDTDPWRHLGGTPPPGARLARVDLDGLANAWAELFADPDPGAPDLPAPM